MWPRGWVEVQLYSSMTAALEGVEWSAARPGRTLPPGKTRYPLYRRLGGPQGRSGLGGKSRPHRDSIPDRPARSQSLYRLSYRAHERIHVPFYIGVSPKNKVTAYFYLMENKNQLRTVVLPDFTAHGILSE